MTKPGLSRLQARIDTDLSDAELQSIIDAADAEVVRRYGAHPDAGARTETIEPDSPRHNIYPSLPVASVTSVTEYTGSSVGAETTTVLSANDYRLLDGGRRLRRLTSGDNPRGHWGHRVDLDYTPLDDGLERSEVILKLAILDVQYRGLRQERAGDYSATQAEYQREREAILSGLHLSGAALVS